MNGIEGKVQALELVLKALIPALTIDREIAAATFLVAEIAAMETHPAIAPAVEEWGEFVMSESVFVEKM